MAIAFKNFIESQSIPDDCRERFIHFGNPDSRIWERGEISVAGISDVVRGYRIERFHSASAVVLCITRGKLLLQFDTKEERPMETGNIFFFPPQTHYCYQAKAPCTIVWFHMNPDTPLWKETSKLSFESRICEHLEQITSLMEMLWRECTPINSQNLEIQKALCQAVILYLYRELIRNSKVSEHTMRIRKVFEQVGRNLGHPWKIAELAKHAGMSEANFYLVARRIYNNSPWAIVNEMRITAAAKMLESSDIPLMNIAQTVGFDSGFSLSRAFRKHFGVSPRHWQQRKPMEAEAQNLTF